MREGGVDITQLAVSVLDATETWPPVSRVGHPENVKSGSSGRGSRSTRKLMKEGSAILARLTLVLCEGRPENNVRARAGMDKRLFEFGRFFAIPPPRVS